MASSAIFERETTSVSRAVAVLALIVSLACVFGVFLLVMDVSGRHIGARFADVHVPFRWAYMNEGGYLVLIAGTVACLYALAAGRGTAMKAVLFGVALSAFAMVEWALSQSYFSVVGTRVEVVSALPWQEPVRFDLQNAEIVERGCDHWVGRRRRDTVNFTVRDRATGTTVNLGAGLNAYGVGNWLRVMQPYITGGIPLTEGEATERNPVCASGISVLLPEPQRAQLRQLLGIER